MKHAREDYNRIQDPENKIPADEPVLLFRAQDKYAPEALLRYIEAIRSDKEATIDALAIADIVDDLLIEFWDWDKKKSPDLKEKEQ